MKDVLLISPKGENLKAKMTEPVPDVVRVSQDQFDEFIRTINSSTVLSISTKGRIDVKEDGKN